MPTRLIKLDRDAVVRWWLHRQGLASPRGTAALDTTTLTAHLERTGGLQLDSVNVLDRAHYLTLWSRFGPYDRRKLDRMIYEDRQGFEYWGHEASILPASHLPIARHRMSRYPTADDRRRSHWPRYRTSIASKRRVLRRLQEEGPLESSDFQRHPREMSQSIDGWSSLVAKEDSRSLRLLWHAGKVAVCGRRHFRRIYDRAERIYPLIETYCEGVSKQEFDDSWLLRGLSGSGIASEAHLRNYITGPSLKATDRSRVISRQLRKGAVVAVEVNGFGGPFYALTEHLDRLSEAPQASGTTLICPFDSLLWQRKRAAELLGFEYSLEIYVPATKRKFGYYVLPILHDGRLVGRLDPKLHRKREELEIKSILLESGFVRQPVFERGLAASLQSLAEFVGAKNLTLPKGWRSIA